MAVGAPTPHIDELARARAAPHLLLLGAVVQPVAASLLTGRLPMRHGLLRPPMYGEPGGLDGEVTLAELLSGAGYATQAVGKWHMGENRVSQPQHVGFDDFYGFLSVSDMTPNGATPTSSPRSSTAPSAPSGCGTSRSTAASCTPPGAATPRTSRR